ncbi:MAG: hypothetical protein GX027_04885 [Clostridiaceae bacterium]|nr:hypothetical protein [Clostridiaceae bacterium]
MGRKTIGVFISICCILAVILAAALINRYRAYPSVFGNTLEMAPGIEFSARLDSSGGSRQLICVIRNRGDSIITYGEEYYLEREKDGEWFEVNDKTGHRADEKAWNELAYFVPAGSEKEFVISLNSFRPLPEGSYRIIKKISRGENSNPTEIIAAYFTVE